MGYIGAAVREVVEVYHRWGLSSILIFSSRRLVCIMLCICLSSFLSSLLVGISQDVVVWFSVFLLRSASKLAGVAVCTGSPTGSA